MEPSTPRSRLANPVSPPKPPQARWADEQNNFVDVNWNADNDLVSPPKPPEGYRRAPLDFGFPPPNTRQLGESDQDDFAAEDWNAKTFLGPRFPSMENTTRRCYKEEQKELQMMINEELQNIHRLENDINKTIYGQSKPSGNPCSMLDYQDVVCAASAPELLNKDPKKQIAMMKNVLQMMEDAKAHHQGILTQLQVPLPAAQRQSDRLQQKQRRNYKTFHSEGY